MKEGQLDKMLNYVSDNPRRRFLRRMNPYFNKRRHIIDGNGNEYETYGNLSLLDDTDIEAVRISSKFSAEELRQRKLNWKRTVENCGVLASPFISEAEKKVRDWALENGGCLIYIETNGLGPCFTPKGRLHELCCEGRLLIVAPTTHLTAKTPLLRRQCETMNALLKLLPKAKSRRYIERIRLRRYSSFQRKCEAGKCEAFELNSSALLTNFGLASECLFCI